MKKVSVMMCVVALLGGCTTTMTNFALVMPKTDSVNNVVIQNENISKKYCAHLIFSIIPVTFINFRDTGKYIQKTIEYGNKKGIEGNALVDAKIKHSLFYLPLIWASSCLVVEGTMATLKTEDVNGEESIEAAK